MAFIPLFFLDSVVAIGVPTTNNEVGWVASGFLFGQFVRQLDGDQESFSTYLVTNRHVLEGLSAIRLKFNPEEAQPAREFEVELKKPDGNRLWVAHPNENVDVAVIPINFNILRDNKIKFGYFQSDSHTLDLKKAGEAGVSEGDFVYVLGFPMGLTGGQRQFVIVRGGTIARIRDAISRSSSDFLIDASMFPGNSGGPVIIKPELVSIEGTKSVGSSYLIGMVKSYLPYQDVAISNQTKRPRIIFEENSGLASVEPVDYIQEVIRLHMSQNPIPL